MPTMDNLKRSWRFLFSHSGLLTLISWKSQARYLENPKLRSGRIMLQVYFPSQLLHFELNLLEQIRSMLVGPPERCAEL